METILQELVYALRRLTKAPALTIVVVTVLGLGIGASTTIFSVVDGVLLADLPYDDSEELVLLLRESSQWQKAEFRYQVRGFAPAELADFRQVPSLASVSGVVERPVQLSEGGGTPLRVPAASVSSNLFETLGVRPFLGAGFSDSAGEPGAGKEVVISHGFWRRHFGGAGEVVGRRLELDHESHQVVAVMPPGFAFPPDADLWTPGRHGIPLLGLNQATQPLAEPFANRRDERYYSLVARRGSGATVEQVDSDLAALRARLFRDFPEPYEGARFFARPLKEHVVGDSRRQLLVLQGAVLLVLLVASANVASVLLVRSLAQRKEQAIRRALGAGRGRLWACSLGESLLLALGGGLLGAGLAFGAVNLLKAWRPTDLPRLEEVAVNGRVLLFAFALSLLAGLLAGWLPTLAQARRSLSGSLRQPAAGGRSSRPLRTSLVALEVAAALLLLIGAGLLMRSLLALHGTDAGFQPQGVAMLPLELPEERYPTPELRAGIYRTVSEEVARLPGIEAMSLAKGLPFSGLQIRLYYQVQGAPRQPPSGQGRIAAYASVGPGYFRTLGIPLLAGRGFLPQDVASPETGSKAVVVSRRLADLEWPGEEPVGKLLAIGDPEVQGWAEVVGVVGDVRQSRLDDVPAPTIYGAYAAFVPSSMNVVVRSSLRTGTLAEALRLAIEGVDDGLPFEPLSWMERSVAETLAERRLLFILLGLFAGLALVLSGFGLYGLVSDSVARRRREIGIRLALGARRRGVVALVVRQGLALAGLGIAAGLVAALWLTSLLKAFLFEVEARDPLTFVAFAFVLTAVAAVASYLPARRAARVDPSTALRPD